MKRTTQISTAITLILLCMLSVLPTGCTKTAIAFQETTPAGSKWVLENGLTILTKENPATGLVAIDVLVKTGVGSEGEAHGLASLTNRLLLAGTEKRTRAQIAEELESVGGTIEALGWVEYDEILVEVPSESLSTALNILQDILLNPTFPQEEVERERALVIKEIESKEDNPQIVADELLMKVLYKQHHYRHPQSGYVESVKKITREDVVKFYKNWYVPNNIVIAIAGNFDEEKVVGALQRLFAKFHPHNLPEIPKIEEPEMTTPREEKINKPDTESFFLNIGYHTTNSTSPDFAKLKVLSGILGTGASSRLFYEVRDKKGLVYWIGSTQPTTRDKGFIKINMVTRPEALETAMETTFEELKKLKTEPVSEQELGEVKEKMKGFFLQDHQRSADQANFLAFYEIQGKGYTYDAVYTKDIDSVTTHDVQAMAQKYFTIPAVAIVGPFETETESNENGIKSIR